jgi:hypothetical protein
MDRSGRPMSGGHAFHMRAINRIARAGSIAAAVEQGVLTEGIMHACITHDVPFILLIIIFSEMFLALPPDFRRRR